MQKALQEDIGSGDLTAALIAENAVLAATVISRENAVLCGTQWFDACFQSLVADTAIDWSVRDGDCIKAGQQLCAIQGNARALLTAERSALNFLQLLSAVATQTRHYVDAIAETGSAIVDTRKTVPGLRVAQKYAVKCGGGVNHRIGLYDGILIKENHIFAVGGIAAALQKAQAIAPAGAGARDGRHHDSARAARRCEVDARSPSIRTENALLSAYIFIDIRDRDIGGYIADAQQAVREQVQFPQGYYGTWSGQFEYMQRATEKLKIVVPLTVSLVFLLVYLNFGRLTETLIVMLSVPFSLVGGIWLMYWLDYNLSIAAVVGFIGLIGIAAESGMVMLAFIDQALTTIARQRKAMSEQVALSDLYDAVIQGAVYRIRPVMMTIAGSVIGLLPVMLSTGTGSEIMCRIAAPMVGGMVSATILTLIIFPAVYAVVKEIPLRRVERINE